MAVPATKDDLLTAIRTEYARLCADLDRVPTDSARELVLPGHVKDTMMSPADLLAYLIGWNEQVLTWHERRAAGLPDELPAAGFGWNDLGALAQHFSRDHENASWVELRARLDDAEQRIEALVLSRSDQELYGAPWYRTWTMGRMISLNTSSPYRNARGRIRRWLRAR
ncbi:ClbS/DfsB family four-helix bundle protein [Microbacterium oxydans]|uniref:ClbS/DfsB family four-helix bundle protein n=1 Tax=Microbacterium TaxID=33882 RepID=UPI000DE3642D|nr:MULTISPECIES: ClbS/DfsB family four-helix bundle protein [unclassified Microbacterium]MBE7953130.1 ClbS/DfsB family four-helix bundle protein [Microbacterium sp. R1]MCB8045665.1 ClbS/DfsB family four-helix bundle protein [Microbacterium oxydans]NYF26885.1 hypothetical protein [Microbacterium sp. JAI119]RBO73409.1 hypothetical protein DSP71_05455 [Microbacterium sp. H6]